MKKIILPISFTFFGKSISVTIAFLFNLVVVRYLGVDNAGIYFLCHTVLLGVSIVCRFGMDNAVLRFGGELWASKSRYGVYDLISKIYLYTFFIGFVMSIIFFIGREYTALVVFKKEELVTPFLYLGFIIWPFSLVWVSGQFFKAIGRPAIGSFIEIGSPMFIIMFYLSFVQPEVIDASTFVLYMGCASIVVIFASYAYAFLYIKPTLKKGDIIQNKTLFDSCRPILVYQLLNYAVVWAPSLVAGAMLSSKDIALYAIAQRVTNVMSFALLAYGSVIAPQLSALYASNEIEKIKEIMLSGVLILFVMAIPIVFVIMFFSQEILGLFGEEFYAARSALMIVAVGQFFNIMFGISTIALTMIGGERILRNNCFIVAVFTIIMSLILVKYFGLIGAAVSTCMALLLQCVLNSASLCRTFGYNPFLDALRLLRGRSQS